MDGCIGKNNKNQRNNYMSAGTPPVTPAPAAAPMAAATGAAVQPTPAPAPSPMYTPPPAPSASAGPEPTSMGGGGPLREFFSDVNLLDVTIAAFIVGAVLYSIQYHKFMMMLEKTGYADLSTRVQKLESSLEAAKRKAEANASGSMKRKKRLITL